MDQMIQIQQENRVIAKAMTIAIAKRVRRYQANRNIWLVESQTTQGRFYCVKWDEKTDCFACDCKAYEFSSLGGVCKHILACALYEGSSSV